MSELTARNRRTAIFGGTVVVVMLGLTAASVPLYDLFCRVTGYGGTTQQATDTAGVDVLDHRVEVSFNADLSPDLPWTFRPLQRNVDVQVGENKLVFYEAVNTSDRPIVGRAVYNVTPHKVGAYFAKVHCFCFDEQVLQPGEAVEMPVSFYVDPEMLDDTNARDVSQITLSYTFFIDSEATEELRYTQTVAEEDETS